MWCDGLQERVELAELGSSLADKLAGRVDSVGHDQPRQRLLDNLTRSSDAGDNVVFEDLNAAI